jgi:thymidylate kinase
MTRIIAFEGLDLTGKSTLCKYLYTYLTQTGEMSRINKGNLIFKGEYTKEEEEALSGFEKDLYYTYSLVQDNILPIEFPEDFIIQDRYYPSVMYYGLLQFRDKSLANRIDLSNFIQPTNFIYLKSSFEERRKRFLGRDGNNIGDIESLRTETEHDKRTMIYDEVMDKINQKFGNVKIVDTTSKTFEEALKEIVMVL